MEIQFKNNNEDEEVHKVGKIQEGTYSDMMDVRKKSLGEAQATIQKVFKDYDGQTVVVLLQHEDENGNPDYTQMAMAGVASLESQISMAKALHKGSDSVVEAILESCKGDSKMMAVVAKKLLNLAKEKK